MKITLLIGSLLLCSQLFAQKNYWQQQLKYDIKAELNDVEHSITGFETIVYTNNSPSSLDYIWFHIWPNAYSNDSTTLMKQIHNDTVRSKKAEKFGTGHIEGLAFKVDGKEVKTEAHSNPQYIDVIKVVLNTPLAPGSSISISTPFKVFLPPYFSRSGYADGEYMACQWYPKPAVFDKTGWHEFPYLDMGEFYSEYADYNVSITVPSAYIVGATGVLQTQDELAAYKKIGAKNAAKRKKPTLYVPTTTAATKTLTYSAQMVPDFAWFADKNFVIQYGVVKLKTGKKVDAFSYYHNVPKTIWNNSIDYVKDGVSKYSEWVGEYEYPVVQVVEGPANNSSGGMEYPMITLITSPDAKIESLDAVIAHEIGHNWFMGMLGSNERDHAWMDEGLNTYFQFRYEALKYKSNSIFGDAIPKEIKELPTDQFLGIIYNAIAENVDMPSPMDIPSDQFPSSEEYSMSSYIKTALWMYILESSIGRDATNKAVQHYFDLWKNKHPQPEDMQAAFEESTGADLDKFFELTKKEGKFIE